MSFLIGVDIGTTGIKAGLFDEEGTLVADAYHETALHYPAPGAVEQDPEDFYVVSCRTIREAIDKAGVDPSAVAGIGFCGQMAGIIGIDRHYRAVTRYDSWLDGRCGKYVDSIRDKFEDEIIKTVGMPVTISHAPKMLWWKNERPNVFREIYKFIQPAGYVAGRLCGLKGDDAFIDYTYLHFSGVSDALSKTWSERLCRLLDLPIEKLPKIVKPWEIIGELTPDGAEDCGLVPGIPVVAGAGDQAAGYLGAGLVEPGLLVDVAGTAACLTCCVDRYEPDTENRTLLFPRGVQENLWFPHAYVAGGGLCLRWFRDEFALWEREEAKRLNSSVYGLLDEGADKVAPGSERLFFIPHLGGRAYPSNSAVRGQWFGLSWNHGRFHLYRAVLESIAYEYRYYLTIMQRLFPDIEFKEIRVIGGGSRSPLWNQIKADVLGIRYITLNREEVAVLGSALLAGFGAKVFINLNEKAMACIKPVREFIPHESVHYMYQKYADFYIQLTSATDPCYDKLDNLSEAGSE